MVKLTTEIKKITAKTGYSKETASNSKKKSNWRLPKIRTSMDQQTCMRTNPHKKNVSGTST